MADDGLIQVNGSPDRKKPWVLVNEADSLIREAGFHYAKAAQAFCTAGQYAEAAEAYQHAVEWAGHQGLLLEKSNFLYQEAGCRYRSGQLTHCLYSCMSAASLNMLSPESLFNNYALLFRAARQIPLPIQDLNTLLKRLKSLRDILHTDEATGMTSLEEALLLIDCGQNAAALAVIQGSLHTNCLTVTIGGSTNRRFLIDALRRNGQIAQAWDALCAWKSEGESKYAYLKSIQLYEEAKLLHTDGQFISAWRTILSCAEAEKKMLRLGSEIDTLRWMIHMGVDAGMFQELKICMGFLFRFRKSESLIQRYYCYEAIARYYLALYASGTVSGRIKEKAKHHADFWLTGRGTFLGAIACARKLDWLFSSESEKCTRWIDRIQAIKKQYYVGS